MIWYKKSFWQPYIFLPGVSAGVLLYDQINHNIKTTNNSANDAATAI